MLQKRCTGLMVEMLVSPLLLLTCMRNRSASAALPAATHWKVAFCPALTSTSPRREK